MKKRLCFGLGCLGLLMFLSRLFFFGFEVGIQDAWAQARTVLYKDFQQTVTVAHVFNNVAPASPPFTVTGNSSGVPATGLAPDRIGLTTVLGLPVAGTPGRVRRLTDGGAVGAIVVDDGTNWTCVEAKSQKIAVVTCPPYNAVGDGVVDDTNAIQSAINASERVFLPKGTYLVGDGNTANLVSFVVPSNRRIEGAGVGATYIKLKNAGESHLFNIEGVTDVTISDLTVDGNRTNNTLLVHGFRLNGARRVWLQNLNILNVRHYGIGINSLVGNDADDIYIDNVRLEGCGGDCINLHNNNSGRDVKRIVMNNINIINPVTVDTGGAGIDVRGAVTMSNIQVTADIATNVNSAVNFRLSFINQTLEQGAPRSTLTNFYFKSGPTPLGGNAGLSINSHDVSVSNGYIEGYQYGVLVSNGVVETFLQPNRVALSNIEATLNLVHGIFVQGSAIDGTGATNFTCVNCRVFGNTGDGMRIDGDYSLIANLVSRDNAGTGLVIAGAATGTVVNGAHIVSNLGGAVTAGSSVDTSLSNFKGYVTESKGTATIANTTTFVDVLHSLGFTPTVANIRVTPTNNQGLATRFWISNVTATQFRINSDVDPGATTATYAWKASWN